jgi:hypothetical protein
LPGHGLTWCPRPSTAARDGRAGSLQRYIEHDPNAIALGRTRKLRPVALFDIIANNADRKGARSGWIKRTYLADRSRLCFHVDDKCTVYGFHL